MIEHMKVPSIIQFQFFQHSIGQVLRSRCHLYLFSFSKPPTRLCPLTRGPAAHLLGRFPFSLQLGKCSSRGPAARLPPSRALCRRGIPGTFLSSNAFSKTKSAPGLGAVPSLRRRHCLSSFKKLSIIIALTPSSCQPYFPRPASRCCFPSDPLKISKGFLSICQLQSLVVFAILNKRYVPLLLGRRPA